MAVYKMTFLACDECGEEFDAFARSVTEVRQLARKAGWARRGIDDVCPKHQRQSNYFDVVRSLSDDPVLREAADAAEEKTGK